jgi:hypothetical protein
LSKSKAASKLRDTQEAEFKSVLNSSKLENLGDYLENKLGKFTVDEYCRDTTVESRVEKILVSARHFLGTEIGKPSEIPKPPEIEPAESRPLPTSMQPVYRELQRGETWNALARLRREIEVILRKQAKKKKILPPKIRSAGKLVRELAQQEIIDPNIANQLSYAIQVANQAIHGYDVTENEAETAVKLAAAALNSIKEKSDG